MKFIIKYVVENAKQVKGEEPHTEIWETETVDADNLELAKAIFLDGIRDEIVTYSTDIRDVEVDEDNETVSILSDDGEIETQYRIIDSKSKEEFDNDYD